MTEAELRSKYPELIPNHAKIDVRKNWLGLMDQYFQEIRTLYLGTTPSISLYVAYELNGRLVIDCDDLPWTGNQDRQLKQKVRQLAEEFKVRSADV